MSRGMSSKSRRRQEKKEFAEFLDRIQHEGPSGKEDDARIAHFPSDRLQTRQEIPIPLYPSDHSRRPQRSTDIWSTPLDRESNQIHRDFLTFGDNGNPVSVFESLEDGLTMNGWSLIPMVDREDAKGAKLGEGAFGKVYLAYNSSEKNVPLEYRHLSAVKIQPRPPLVGHDVPQMQPQKAQVAWIEINVLRGCVHDNIVSYFGHFVVRKDTEKDVSRLFIVLLLDYASAGDLHKEIHRYSPQMMPESGALYYIRHVIAGLSYLHHKFVLHNDLHEGNVLLRYNHDGSKTAMIGDFGKARVHHPADVRSGAVPFDTSRDVLFASWIIDSMLRPKTQTHWNNVSRDVRKIIDPTKTPKNFQETLEQLVNRFKWFSGKAQAPFPDKPPTPLLDPVTITRMNYQPEPRPPPGWSLREQLDRAGPEAKPLYHWSAEPTQPRRPTWEWRKSPNPAAVAASTSLTASQSMAHQSAAPEAPGPVHQTVGQRIRRSMSGLRQRLNCFRNRHRQQEQ